jgi:hypothetical protein
MRHWLQTPVAQKEKRQENKCWREWEPLYTVGKNVNWYSYYGKQCESSQKKLEVSCDPLLGMYLNLNVNKGNVLYLIVEHYSAWKKGGNAICDHMDKGVKRRQPASTRMLSTSWLQWGEELSSNRPFCHMDWDLKSWPKSVNTPLSCLPWYLVTMT